MLSKILFKESNKHKNSERERERELAYVRFDSEFGSVRTITASQNACIKVVLSVRILLEMDLQAAMHIAATFSRATNSTPTLKKYICPYIEYIFEYIKT